MSSTISVFVSSPDTYSERRYDLHTTIGQLKVNALSFFLSSDEARNKYTLFNGLMATDLTQII